MKGVKGSGREGERKLTLEEYMDFCDRPHRPDFVVEQLNHIIFMHGFVRLYRRAKAEIMSTLDAMELVQASRSTLEEGVGGRGGGAPLAAEEVRRDLEAIGWRECPIGSIRSVGPPAGAVEDASSVSAICCPRNAGSAAGEKAAKAARTRKRKRARGPPLLALAPAPSG